ncbi:GP155 protein, partial [Polypterus senegalus]
MTVMPSTENYNYGLRNMTLTSTMAIPPSMSIDKLFPALLECFGIILCGYIAGRANIITSSQAKGLGNFVSKFALPALLFKNMVLLDFANVIWSFLWSILIAKVTVFVIVCVLTLLVASPDSRLSKAGLFSIFATQSNDFALGYPHCLDLLMLQEKTRGEYGRFICHLQLFTELIDTYFDALYGNTYPEYLQYIYLVAPISLMILNPIGFVFCEIQKWKDNRTSQQSKLRIIGVVLLQVLKNPIVFMVIVGISMHFILGQKIPAIIEQFVDGLGNSFGGSALFYLGLSMVGQIRKLTKSTFVSLILLITAKLLVMPLICREMVELLDRNSSTGNHTSLSNYAFLYGVFPTAPSVAIYASQYNMELEIVWSVAVMILSKKFKRLPHLFTTNLLLAQFLVCVGMILWKFIINQNNFIGQVLVFILLYSSLYSTYLWTGLIALSLLLLRKDDEPKIRMAAFIIAGWGIPAFIVGMLLIAGHKNEETLDSAFFYGKPQIMSTAVVLLCSIVVAGVSLMFLSRSYQDSDYQVLDQTSLPGTSEDLRPLDNQESPQVRGTVSSPQLEASIQEDSCPCGLSNGKTCCSSAPVPDMIACRSRSDAPNGQAGLFMGKEKVDENESAVSEEIRMTCRQFVRYHKDQCVRDIVQQRRCGIRTSADIFCGCDLVDWLLRVGLAHDRGEATEYGEQLLQGGVLQHISGQYEFQDDSLFYRFKKLKRMV